MDGLISLFTDVWNTIGATWTSFTSLFSSEAFSNVFSALFGAVIGSISGYWFNRRLEKNRTNERYQIQRKNVIYSPIYKKLLAFEKYLSELQNNKVVLIDVEFKEKEYGYGRKTFRFFIWDEINQDIRKNYLLDTQRVAMDGLVVAVNEHKALVARVQKDIEEIVDNFTEKHKGALKQPAAQYQMFRVDVINQLSALAGVDAYYRTSTSPREAIKQRITDEYSFSSQSIQQESNTIVRKLTSRQSFRTLEKSFLNVQKLSEEATSVFEKKIRETINKYEGGL